MERSVASGPPEDGPGRAVAVIGMCARFPGAPDYATFWQNLAAGRSQIGEIPEDRFDWRRYYGDPQAGANKTNTKWGGFLDSIDRFDAAFFGISPREAEFMDPQQRFMMEMTWHCLEDAGYAPSSLAGGRIGVYVGVCNYDYKELQDQYLSRMTGHRQMGTWLTLVPNRVSYWFNFHGPSFPIDTGCSSSLLALHSAVQSLRVGECDMALVGGVSLLSCPLRFLGFGQLGMLSPTGRCWTFDAKADGYVRGEGAALVLLKPLAHALRDGDHVHGVVLGSASNHGGRARTITSPNAYAQSQVIVDAHVDAGVPPDSVTYIEAHGTGTPMGDPIEVHGLRRAFGRLRRHYGVRSEATNYCGLGTVKTHVGHTEATAGVAGLLNVLLSMKNGALPGVWGFTSLNPAIDLAKSPFYVLEETRPWSAVDADGRPSPRRAGISSFGAGGANAHVVVEEAPQAVARPAEVPGARVVVLSARSDDALRAQAGRYADFLESRPEVRLGDVALTTSTGRDHLGERLAVVGTSGAQVAASLRAFAAGDPAPGSVRGSARAGTAPSPVFLFTGQGAQYAGMGRALYDAQPVFRRALDRCDAVLRSLLPRPLLDVLHGGATELLDETAYTQPALFSLEYALAELWRSWGVRPAAVLGHSVGEYVAACVAGVFGLEDGLKLIAARGRLMQELPRDGAMAAVFADEERVAAALTPHRDHVAIAAVNGPGQVVISGRRDRVAEIGRGLAADGITVKPLAVSHAFHSPLMLPMLDAFEAVASEVAYAEPRLPLVSNVTGALAKAEVASAAYWRGHVLAAVRFHDGIRSLHEAGHALFLELGPRPTLSDLGRRCLPAEGPRWVPALRREGTDVTDALEALAALHAQGVAVDWAAVQGGDDRRLPLPTYPFEGRRYWLDLAGETGPAREVLRPAARTTVHPLLGQRHVSATHPGQVIHEATQSLAASPAFLADHRAFDAPVFPAAGFLETMLAAWPPRDGGSVVLEDVEILRPLVLDEGGCTVQCIVDPEAGGRPVRIFSRPQAGEDGDGADGGESADGGWRLHASGRLRHTPPGDGAAPLDRGALEREAAEPVDDDALYRRALERGLAYGPSFRAVTGLRRGEGSALARVRLPEGVADGPYLVHPVVLDGCLQVLLALLPGAPGTTYLPAAIRRLRLLRAAPRALWCHARLQRTPEGRAPEGGSREASAGGGGAATVVADLLVFDDAGAPVVEIEGLTLRPATRGALLPRERAAWRDWLYEVDWQPRAARGPAERPDYLPAPEALAAPLRAEAAALVAEADGGPGLCRDLETASFACIVAAFRRNGIALAPGERFTAGEAGDRMGVVASQRKLLGRLLEVLAEEGVLRGDGDGWSVACAPEEADPAARLRAVLDRHPASGAELGLLERTGPRLGDVLAGRSDPLQLMFPGGDLSAATRLYEESLETRAANTLVARAVALALEALPQDRAVRMLEIGAGTGATTASVLPVLPRGRFEYLFTDVTAMFTVKAAERFRDQEGLRFRVLDVEKASDTQGIEPHSVDLVLAANVVHATRDLAETLQNVRRILAPGGILLLLEGSERRRWIDLTFGLLEGWWRFADHDLRPDYPLIRRDRWKDLLARTGYDAVETVELPRPEAELIYPQSVVLARAGDRVDPVAAAPLRRWLVLADGGGVGDDLARRLSEAGDGCTVAVAGAAFERGADGRVVLDPAEPTQVGRLLEALDAPPDGVVHLLGLDVPPPAALAGGPVEAMRPVCTGVLALVQALVRSGAKAPALWLVTRGAVHAGAADTVPGLAQSALWGMAKAIEVEHPELRCVRVDLDPEGAPGDASALSREVRVAAADRDDQVAFRRGARHAARLVRLREPSGPERDRRDLPDGPPFRLASASRGTLESLRWLPAERVAPGRGEIEIRVRACGLNFIDVLDALGLAPYARAGFGLECAGEVVAVGEGVDELRVGDEVVAVGEGCFGEYVTTRAALAVRKPSTLTMAEAASIPANFLTAHHALAEIARVGPGQRVLVHAAAGGTGMAAVQLARRAGAEVWGTASRGKWAVLHEMGVTRAMDSRTLEFADRVADETGGEGVDVVLNSLAGDYIPRSLRAVRAGGTFLEIGMTGAWTAEQAAAVNPGARYAAIDLFGMCRHEPERVGAMLRHLMDRFAVGELRPVPHREIPASEIVSAFRTMQGARHVGKLVVVLPASPGDEGVRLEPNATYLVVGGLRGLGPSVARWLADAGARHLALLGRGGIHEEAVESLRALAEAGVTVRVLRGDVAREADVRGALDEIRASMPPLRGVIHSAGLLDDGALVQQSWDRFATVLGPKVDGAWHLHAMTRDLPLDFFVLFSSVASLLGSAGQANHSAANAFLDALAAFRRARGLPALSINWGAWSGIGAAARRAERDRLSVRGLDWIPPAQGIDALAGLFRVGRAQVGVAPVTSWAELLQARTPASFFEAVRPAAKPDEAAGGSFLRQLEETPAEERRARLVEHVRAEIRTVLGFDASVVLDPRTGFFDLGMDSLTAVELRNRLQSTFGASLPATVTFDHPTIAALADYLLAEVLAPAESAAARGTATHVPAPALTPAGAGSSTGAAGSAGAAAATAAPAAAEGLDDLSDDELAELLGRELSEHRPERRP